MALLMQMRGQRSSSRWTLALVVAMACSPSGAQTLAADCATPGKDGDAFALSGILNTYYPGTNSPAVGARCITVGTRAGAATAIAAGDLLLVIQMQDATIDSADDSGYGDNVNGVPGGVTNYQSSGRYEYVTALGAVGTNGGVGCGANQVPIRGRNPGPGLINAYRNNARATARGRGSFQVIRVPQYNKATLAGTLTAPYWNGVTGGIVALDVVGLFNPGGNAIDVTGRGFRGGGGRASAGDGGGTDATFRQNVDNGAHGAKGEGIAGSTRYLYNQETGALVTFSADEGYNNGGAARGAPGSAGGGGTDSNSSANDENSGGGGGANGGAGGLGGNAWNSNATTGGYGGGAFAPGGTALDRIVAGGGGGAGARNNSTAQQSSGGAGGGMVLIQSGQFGGTGTITATGAQGPAPDNDGGGGGGAGGTIVLRDNETVAASDASGITLMVTGANGSDAWITQAPGGTPGARHGPGGGGGGGRVLLGPTLATGTVTFSGGLAGRTTTALDNYGALPGGIGSSAGFTGTPPGILPGFQCALLPVSLAYVELRPGNAGVNARWATAAEVNTVAFRWFADVAAEQPLQMAFTASERGNAAEPTSYQAALQLASGAQYWLAEYDRYGNREMHGPYRLNQPVGASPKTQAIDWAALADANRISAQRVAAKLAAGGQIGARLMVDRLGFQRLRYEDLLAAGIDLQGLANSEIAVLRNKLPVPRRVVSVADGFGPGSYVEFYGEPRDSLYGAEAAYMLVQSAASALNIPTDEQAPGPSRPAWAMASADYAPELAYNFASPTADPWYADRLLAYANAPVGKTVHLPLSAVADIAVDAELSAAVIGVTDWSGVGLDHNVRLQVAGQWVDQASADGISQITLSHRLVLAPASTDLEARVEATGATGFAFDVVNLDAVRLKYPRLAVAESGRWLGQTVQFGAVANDPSQSPPGASSTALLVDGFEDIAQVVNASSLLVRALPSSDVVAYARSGDQWRYLAGARAQPVGTAWDVFVPTVNSGDDVFVAVTQALLQPRIEILPTPVDIQSGSAAYLVISHALFADSLGPLLSLRQSQGLSTDVVNVADIYAQFGNGEPDPEAIRAYVRFAAARRGTRYVVLVGGDTYDYHNYLGTGSISYVPTFYRATSAVVSYAPLDSVIADIDDDGVADLALGRLPVRTVDELSRLISKIIAAEAPMANRSALLVSGASDSGNSFPAMSDAFAAQLPGAWSLTPADVDTLGASAARQLLLQTWRTGLSLVSYVGHSAPGQWTFDPLINVSDVSLLAGSPAVPTVVQWGCWNTYFVSPSANSLGQALLLQGSHGAAAVFGASALTDISNHNQLGPELMFGFERGVRIGDAVRDARHRLAAKGQRSVETQQGSNLLGDPAMFLQ